MNWTTTTDLLGDELGHLLRKEYIKNSMALAMPSLNTHLLAQYAPGFRMKSYPAVDIIIRQGDPVEMFFVLASGRVKITRETEGRVEPEAELEKGQFFGEMGLLNRQPRNATVSALTDVEVVCLPREEFLKILHQSSKTREDVALTICNRLL